MASYRYNPFFGRRYTAVPPWYPYLNAVPNLVADSGMNRYNPCYFNYNHILSEAYEDEIPRPYTIIPFQDPAIAKQFIYPRLVSNIPGTAFK